MSNLNNLAGPLASLMSSVTWAVSVSLYSRLSREHYASAVNFTRALVALPLAVVVGLWYGGGLLGFLSIFEQVSLTHVVWFTFAIISGYAFGDLLFLMSTRSLGVPASMAIASSYPLWSALAGWFFEGETLSGVKIAGLFATVIGTVVVILVGYSQYKAELRIQANQSEVNPQGSYKQYWLGVLLANVTALFWAFNTFATARGGKDISTLAAVPVRLLIAFILCPVIGYIFDRRAKLTLPPKLVMRYFFFFAFEGCGGAYLYVYGMNHSPLAIASALSALSPVMSAPIAWFFGWEKFSLAKTFGILLVVFGVFLLVS